MNENKKHKYGSSGPPRDPPYRGMQTSTNIHMNI